MLMKELSSYRMCTEPLKKLHLVTKMVIACAHEFTGDLLHLMYELLLWSPQENMESPLENGNGISSQCANYGASA